MILLLKIDNLIEGNIVKRPSKYIKTPYVADVNVTNNISSYDSSIWSRLSLSVTNPSTSYNNGLFTIIGKNLHHKIQSINGYMVEIFCHNVTMTDTDMQQYQSNVLF